MRLLEVGGLGDLEPVSGEIFLDGIRQLRERSGFQSKHFAVRFRLFLLAGDPGKRQGGNNEADDQDDKALFFHNDTGAGRQPPAALKY